MKHNWIYQYLVLHWATFVLGESYYTVIAPGTLKSNRKYTVAVTLHEAQEPCAIRVAIEGPSYNNAKEINVRPFETKQIEFLPPKLVEGYYKLTAEGLTGFKFQNESELNEVVNNGPKIYIQTDKAIYKPQDLVQFRVVILDEHTRPLRIKEPIRIEIFDHLDNRVKQFKDITLTKGVYTGKFQLSQQPLVGDWKIKVIISGKYAFSKLKTFQVLKYVLPKFSVFIKAPNDIVLDDGKIKAIIYGKYTFDKYVEGNVTAELRDPRDDKLLQQKKFDIKTKSSVEFQLDNTKDNEKLYGVSLRVSLTEKYTGITQQEKFYISIRKEHYYITIPDDEIEFKNNKPYRLKAHVEHWSGASVLDSQTPVVMEHGNLKYEAYLDENGVATFEFEHQSEAGHTVMYKDSKSFLPNIFTDDNLMLNNTEYYCKLTLMDKNVRLGKTIEIKVSSADTIPYLVYTIVGHGSLIHAEHIQVPANQKTFTIQIMPSIEMVPQAFVYVHYIHKGNLRYEEMKIQFPEEFENQISVIAPKQVRPGQEVTISLKAQPKSYVSILAVDLSVCLLDCSYDLKKHEILDDLRYDTTHTPIAATVYPGLTSGLITLTNANYPFTPLYGESDWKGDHLNNLRFRTKFPETWIFENYEITNAHTELTLNIPDTITTWRITAFTNNDITGFGIVDEPTDVTTIQPFFILPNLPYSVKRGEIVDIPLTLFNYLNQSVDAEVIMYNNDDEFYFMESTVQGAEKSPDDQQQIKQISSIPIEGGKTVSYLINPKKVGEINLRITATNSLYSDAIQQKLKVEPEGVTKYQNQAIFLSVPKGETFSSSFLVDIPNDRVPDSEFINLSVGGDFLVPTLDNLNDLVQLPTGCGEQNMVNFAPNILILQYLKAIGKFAKDKELVRKIKSYTDIGYQQQLSYRHKNGGFSVFGEKSDTDASSWLTAYVVRFFIKASKYSPIETRIIESGLEFLANLQKANGEFEYTGYLFEPADQSRYGYAAFVLLAFLEDSKYATKYDDIIQKGLEFLNSNLDNVEDVYSLAVVASALQMANHPNAKKITDKLITQKMVDENGLMWWSENDENPGKDVEITAYALIALLDTPGDHLPILKWLIEQRNAQGGFKSTHDTVVGLQALVKFSEKYNNPKEVDLKITYCAKDLQGNEVNNEFTVQADNVLILQKHELPTSTRQVNYVLSGTGQALLQISYQYNVYKEPQFKHFLITPKAKLPNLHEMNLEVCFTYQSSLSNSNDVTNMVIMEANLPSGYRSDAESSLIDNELIQRIESKNSESTIVLYFENLSANIRHCLNIPADKTNDVMDLKPAAIIMYDYYNLSRSNTEFYKIQK